MSVRDDVLRFLREPLLFAAEANDADLWLAGLDHFAKPSILNHQDRTLRDAQEKAWRGLADNRAGLVLGPPGTGKTHLLSWLVAAHAPPRLAASKSSRVLITAFTKNAIGNVLDAVVKRQAMHDPSAPAPIYFGSPPNARLSPKIELLGRGDETALFDALEGGRAVVGATIWSLYRLLSEGHSDAADGPTAPLFDLICVDEASQMVLGHGLMALGALAPFGRLVVCGDDQQLPPVRSAREIEVGGRQLGGSLYAFMKSAKAAEFALEETFRLNAPLAHFPERKFYSGRYIAAAPDQKLALIDGWSDGLDLVTRTALDPNFPVIVLVHDGPSASTANPLEANLAAGLATGLAECSGDGPVLDAGQFWSETAAIVSPHRAQNAAIRQSLPYPLRSGAFVETVDRIQGKERDAIILSYCVADPEFALAEGEFIFSSERLNVAVTRARAKLVMIISRRLLEAVPGQQEVMDKAEILREFVYSCPSVAETEIDGPAGRRVRIDIRARGFDGAVDELDLRDEPPPPEELPEMTAELEGVLQAIRTVVSQGDYPSAFLSQVKRAMAAANEPFAQARCLHLLGWVSLEQRQGKHGRPYWQVRPFDQPRRVYPLDLETVRSRIGVLVREARSGRHSYYDKVRDRFAWMTPRGEDAFLPLLRELEREGLIRFDMAGDALTLSLPQAETAETEAALDAPPSLSDDDFVLLNALEDLEAARINFGVSETWTSMVELARRLDRPADDVIAALGRLEASGFVMLAQDARVRSRLAELAREVRHAKQRFRSDDADRRPYLVRNLKVELRDRDKPVRDRLVEGVFERTAEQAPAAQQEALSALHKALHSLWGDGAALAAFQERGLAAGLAGWRGEGPTTLAIAAETGSGKTEAACLPLIAGALADRLQGINGTRVVLAYPRIRLAANQAQRLATYLAALGAVPGAPLLTLGLQVKDVPDQFPEMHPRYAESWPKAGPDRFRFPFFACPACGKALLLNVAAGEDGADALVCVNGDWRFDGWIGSKHALRARPPALFLPTTDSLHQWLHDPRSGRLFGDDPGFAPPRALLADEIHLYTHIHGAQVALALRRLAARAQVNDPQGRQPLAIGMSATIGDPARAWGRLIGREEVTVIRPAATETDTNPRGREYFIFIQPEVESRGADIAGASTTIQSLMCLGHGMRRRTGEDGGYRSIVFFDSIDKMRRLHGAYMDAEEKELAAFRINAFGDDALGESQASCCREPFGCGRFRDGECWFFAANDPRQCGTAGLRAPGAPLKVVPSPIYSGTSSNAEGLIKGADVVFATSSLEVGYDDPDISLVYQHYAPQNLASFVQRKGRGGRGLNDRPMTAVTLSVYSPRDSWWFRRPREMVSPTHFDAPLNPDNGFVRRGQVLATLLDGLARIEFEEKASCLDRSGEPRLEAIGVAAALVESTFGPNVWTDLGFANAQDFWAAAWRARRDGPSPRYLGEVRNALSWAPDLLFDTINLPSLEVTGPDVYAGGREDVTLAFATVAPGNATRRYSSNVLHWRPPAHGRAAWLDERDYEGAERINLAVDEASLLAQLPLEARDLLDGVHLDLVRPKQIRLERIGWMAGAFWNPEVGFSSDLANPITPLTDDTIPVRHDSRGELRGFLMLETDPARGRRLDGQGLGPSISRVDLFAGEGARSEPTGLSVARVYWGADCELRLDQPKTDPVPFAQVFSEPQSDRPLLHGYRVESEGVKLTPSSNHLDRLVETIMDELEDDERERRWRAAQFTRYLVASGAKGAGINAYEAGRGADLLVAAAGHGDLRKRLNHLLAFWSPGGLATLFEDTRAELLHQHPMMSQARVAKTAQALGSQDFQALIKRALADVRDPVALSGYLRSTILHSLALRSRQWAAHLGQAEDGRLLAHLRLPIQFGADANDEITICEAGAMGDGTIRTLAERWQQGVDLWSGGFISDCPNAAEDEILRRFWRLKDYHEQWRAADPRDPHFMRTLMDQLAPAVQGPLPALVLKILFGTESVEAEPFSVYDIAEALEEVRTATETSTRRELYDWEFASAAVSAATSNSSAVLARLLDAYRGLDASSEGSFAPESRLAEQAFRLATPLCADGCRSCVHLPSDVMSDHVAAASVSRRLLERFVRAGPR